MTDYSTLDNAALRRVIAERLGWQVVPSTWDELHNEQLYSVYDPTGREVEILLNETGLENFWWRREVPDWPRDANAALALVSGDDVFTLEWLGNCWYVVYNGTGFNVDGKAEADTPARAICLAWLAWKDATDDTN